METKQLAIHVEGLNKVTACMITTGTGSLTRWDLPEKNAIGSISL